MAQFGDFSDGEELYEQCQRCGRRLRSQEAREIGYGRVCLKKVQAERAFAEAARARQDGGKAAE